jgi:VacB/RNase II family 3'-5' exoribonuclease
MSDPASLAALARRAMLARGLLPEFSPAALAEASAMSAADASGAPSSVRDLRHLLWASIDNDTSRDLDQLSVAEPMEGGAVKVFVAIADVDALVKKHSAVDRHAEANTTSVYTAAQVFPMLPERLSTDLTSLGEGEERLALVVEMVVSEGGSITASTVYRASVVNRAKLAYNAVAAWLEGKAPEPAHASAVPGLDTQLRMQDRAAQAMRKQRYEHGALSLQTPEAQPVFDGGQLVDLLPDAPNRAKELIEDFMIAANGTTARFLTSRGFPTLRRVLRAPERWDRIVAIAHASGERLPPAPDAKALAQFLTAALNRDPAGFPELSLSVVKSLGRGEYVLERPGTKTEGHFGLAVSDYTHSTAPNRRFPDLLTQRLLKAALAGEAPPYSNEDLSALARHCTDQETNAAKVERQVRKSAAAQLLVSRVGDRFDGIVTGVNAGGTWIRVAHPAAEGKLVRGASGLDVGDRVQVVLEQADVARGYIDFARVDAA